MRIAEHLTIDDLKAEPPAHLTGDELALWKYQRYMEDYLSCVASVDDNVGRVVDHLQSRDVFDDTIVIYASDQGFFLGDHGWFDKRFVYEQSIHMPFVMSYPRGIPEGSIVPHMATNVDIAQTLLEACGVDAHSRMHGRSFWSLATAASDEPIHDAMYYRYWMHNDGAHACPAHYGVRTKTHKLICYYNDPLGQPGAHGPTDPLEWELFDLVADPLEITNIIDDPAAAPVLAELRAELTRLQHAVGDQPLD